MLRVWLALELNIQIEMALRALIDKLVKGALLGNQLLGIEIVECVERAHPKLSPSHATLMLWYLACNHSMLICIGLLAEICKSIFLSGKYWNTKGIEPHLCSPFLALLSFAEFVLCRFFSQLGIENDALGQTLIDRSCAKKIQSTCLLILEIDALFKEFSCFLDIISWVNVKMSLFECILLFENVCSRHVPCHF